MNHIVRLSKFRLSLGLKSSLVVIALIVFISALFTSFFIYYLKNSSVEELRKRSLSLANNLAYNSEFAVFSRDRGTLQNLANGVQRESDIVRVAIFTQEGEPLVFAPTDSTHGWNLPDSLQGKHGNSWYNSGTDNTFLTISTINTTKNKGQRDESFLFPHNEDKAKEGVRETIGYVVLEVSLVKMSESLTSAIKRAALITLALVIIATLAVIYIVKKIVEPVYLLAEATREVAHGNFGKVLPLMRADELGDLAISFNEMSLQLKQSKDDINTLNDEIENRVARSTSELMEKHSELQQTIDHLKDLDAAKDDFLSQVSHELRTPLNSIQMFSEILLKGLDKTEEKRADILNTVINNCRRLTALINDVLDLSRIEAGHIKLNLTEIELVEIIRETLNTFRPNLDNRQISCFFNCTEKQIILLSDPYKIIQVLTNILSNAIKFSADKSEIIVSVEKCSAEVIVSVQDFGKGIYESDIPKVFDKFHQMESISLTTEGSGLGMTISKLLIELLGGQISLKSRIHKGTTVSFTLPFEGR